MKRKPILFRAALGLAIFATVLALDQTRRWRAAQKSIAAAMREETALRTSIAAAEKALAKESERLVETEADNTRMIAVIESGALTKPVRAARPRLTQAAIDARFTQAQKREQEGDFPGALIDYLWCYDVGFLRTRDLLGRVAKLGEQYPPAREALSQRALDAERRMLATADEFDAPADLIALNRALKDEGRTLEIFDRLPDGDPRKTDFGRGLFETFVATKRYRDVLRIRPTEQWFQELETSVRREETRPLRERAQLDAIASQSISEARRQQMELARQQALEAQRKATVTLAALGVEILAGAGDVSRARELAEKLIGFDASAEVRALLQQHLTRAGQPDLMGSGAK